MSKPKNDLKTKTFLHGNHPILSIWIQGGIVFATIWVEFHASEQRETESFCKNGIEIPRDPRSTGRQALILFKLACQVLPDALQMPPRFFQCNGEKCGIKGMGVDTTSEFGDTPVTRNNEN